MKPLFGGIPDINPWIDFRVLTEDKHMIKMHTGQGKELKEYKRRSDLVDYDNSDRILCNGTDAWLKPVKLNGTLKFTSNPLNYYDGAIFYDNQLKRNLAFEKETIKTDLQFSLNRLRWKKDNFKADLETFDTEIPGVNNVERFVGFPAFVSLPYFEQGEFYFSGKLYFFWFKNLKCCF